MADEKLLSYIKQSILQGKSFAEIKQQLQIAGWPANLIDESISQINSGQQNQFTTVASAITSNPTTNITNKETTRVKIVALGFFTGGFFGILGTLGTFASVFIQFSSLPDSFLLTLNAIYGITTGIILAFITILLFRISSALHKLEIQGYQSAFIHLSLMAVGSILYIPFELAVLKQPETLIISPIVLILHGLFLYLLYSHRHIFTNFSVRALKIKIIIAEVLLFLIIPFSMFVQTTNRTHTQQLQKDVIRKIAEENNKKNPEPIVNGWGTYSNQQYNFEMTIPTGWNKKEYSPGYGQSIIFAFGSKELPSYWNPDSPYFFISIYPVTDKTNYTSFQTRMSKVGQQPQVHKTAVLGGIGGEETLGTISAEHAGYVYEITLHMIENENLDFQYSDISKQILASFKFVK